MEEALLFKGSTKSKDLSEEEQSIVIEAELIEQPLSIEEEQRIKEKETALANAFVPLFTTSKDPNFEAIKDFKRSALLDLSDYWFRFILELGKLFSTKLDKITTTLLENQRETIAAITLSKDETIANVRNESDRVIATQKAELLLLRTELEKQQEILSLLENEQISRQLEAKRLKEAAERRKNRVRKPIRDAASFPEVQAVLDHIDQKKYRSSFAQSRDRVSLLILFFTGLRISNLLYFTANNLLSFLNEDEATRRLTVNLIKGGNNPQTLSFPITNDYHEICLTYKEDFLVLLKNKEGNDLVFTAENDLNALERSWATNRINLLLKNTSKKYHKTLSSHSLRIGHINSIIEIEGIEAAQQLVDHKNIQTTFKYLRNFHDNRDQTRILAKAAKRKTKPFKRHKESSVILKANQTNSTHGELHSEATSKATSKANSEATNWSATDELFVKLLIPSGILRSQATVGFVGVDLHSAEDCTIPAGSSRRITTGVAMQFPPGCYGRIDARTGMAYKFTVQVLGGGIDNDYKGEVAVIITAETHDK